MDRTPADDHGDDAREAGGRAPGPRAPAPRAPAPRAPASGAPGPPAPDEPDEPAPPDEPATRVAVTVTRTGGIAGLRRTWRAEAVDDDAHYWVELIEQCPWDAVDDGARPDGARGADRFSWLLDARCGEEAHDAELAESDVDGPWRELIDAVRAAGAPLPPVSGRRGPASSSPV